MNWQLEQQGYDNTLAVALGNRFLMGNGYMGVRGTLEEAGKDKLAAINLAGIYDKVGDGWREPLNAPNPFYVIHPFSEKEMVSHKQGLDIHWGLQYRETVYPGGTICAKRFCSMADAHLLALSYECQGSPVHWQIDTDVWDINGPHFVSIETEFSENGICVLCKTGSGQKVAVAAKVQGDMIEKEGNGFKIQGSFTMLAAIYHSVDGNDPQALSKAALAAVPSYDALLNAHRKVWEELWQNAEVAIDGDEEAEFALNYSLYHLMSVAPRHSDSLSIAARGLSGQTYKGAVFWDTEMFMLDFLMNSMPKSAAATLRYRIDTLQGAKEKARFYGYRGAFYAWESQEGGFDACSDYNVTDVFTGRPMRTFFKDKQYHISAAVVYGLMSYLRHTGDDSLLESGGAEVIFQCARFYHSLLVKHVEKETFEIWDVIGPDEYHERVDNNFYTNEMARFVFETAWELKDRYPAEYEKELNDFYQASQKLKRQVPNKNGVIAQFDGYFNLEDVSVSEVRSRLLHEKEYWGGAYGVATHTQVIKQADVVALLYMLRDQYTQDAMKANYDYYESRTEHGSSLSACMYSLIACLIGRPQEAYPLFMKSAKADLVTGGKEWAGLVYIGGTHPAAAGGAYMTLKNGFLGFTIENDTFAFKPNLPAHWKKVIMPFTFKGIDYVVTASKDNFRISPR